MYNEQQLDQAIDVIQSFSTKLRAQIEVAKSSGATLVANMEGDVVAEDKADKLNSALGKVQDVLDINVSSILSKLRAEKERAIIIVQDNN